MTSEPKASHHRYLKREEAPDSVADRTAWLQQEVDGLSQRGGGTLFVGAGVWEISMLTLRDGVCLHLERHAILLGCTDLGLYPRRKPAIDNLEQTGIHLIHAEQAENIAIEGEGTIDGQDMAYWKKAEREEDRPYSVFDYYAVGDRPSPLIEFLNCRQVRVEQVTLRRSPSWTLHICRCQDVRIHRVRIRNHLMGPNADGITINGSQDVWVSECDVVAGDDAICIKATEPDFISERITVTGCIAESNCSCFGTGADVRGIIRDVLFSNCTARRAMRMIQVNMWHEGLTENVIFSNIIGNTFPSAGVTCERAIYVDVQRWVRKDPALGRVRNILFSNIMCRTRGRIVLTAQDGATLENIVLRDVHLDVPEIEDPETAYAATRSYQSHNHNLETRSLRAVVVADNVQGLRLDGVSVSWPKEPAVPMHALAVRNTQGVICNSPGLVPTPGTAPRLDVRK